MLGRMLVSNCFQYIFNIYFNAFMEQIFSFKSAFFSIKRCTLVVEDVKKRPPAWNLTLFSSKDHMSSSHMGELPSECQAVSMPLG